MPQFNSIEALEICKEKKIAAPFILVTGAVSDEFAVNCLKMGAVDYILKTNLSRLPQAIKQAMHKHLNEMDQVVQKNVLRKQNEDLIKINKELDAFAYRISHDLRSPLSSILGLIELARTDGHNSKEQTNYFEIIEQNIVRLDSTLREILDYYRNARGEVMIEEVNMEKIINQGFECLKFVSGFNDIEKLVHVVQKTILQSDAYRWSVIISNLISNGFYYRDASRPDQVINISVIIDCDRAVFEIRDNGIGIHEDQLPKIFDMFYRATEKSRGVGLGLYIVKEMIEKMNGNINVVSVYGKGTTVQVSIPNCELKMVA
jgi:signal transduction histidine kinase